MATKPVQNKGFGTHVEHPPHREPHRPSGMKVDKPNFIIFMPDQLRYDALGCNGNKVRESSSSDLREALLHET